MYNCPAGVRKILQIVPFLTPREDTPAQHPDNPNPDQHPRLRMAPGIPCETSQTMSNIQDPNQHPGSGKRSYTGEQTLGLWLAWLRASVDPSQPEDAQDPGDNAMGRGRHRCKLSPDAKPCKDGALDLTKPSSIAKPRQWHCWSPRLPSSLRLHCVLATQGNTALHQPA